MRRVGRPSQLDAEIRGQLAAVVQGVYESRVQGGQCPKLRRRMVRGPDRVTLDLPPGTPVFWYPAAIVARLRKEVGFANTPHVGYRAGIWRREANALAADRLGIKVQRPRPLARCPTCSSWASYLVLAERQWMCRRCAPNPPRGIWVRIGQVAAYRALGVWDRHSRKLRQRLALEVLGLAGRARTYQDLLAIAVGSAVLGSAPLGWTGPRRPRRCLVARTNRAAAQNAQGPVREAPGPVFRALAPFWPDAIIDTHLCLEAHAARVGRVVLGNVPS